MKNLKSVKQSAKTFTLTFEFNDEQELMRLKALSILLGNYNPMRDRMECEERVLEFVNKFREDGYLSDRVDEVARWIY